MARIEGVDLPVNKPLGVALTYIYGIGLKRSQDVLTKANISPAKRTDALSEEEVTQIRSVIQSMEIRIEGDLRREVLENIRRLMNVGCYRGLRHRNNLPTRGQRSHSNARTCRKHKSASRANQSKL